MLELVELGHAGPAQAGPALRRPAAAGRAGPRAWSTSPAVLLLDEPLGALDLKLRRQMQLELKRIQTEVGITFVHVTHDQEEAMTMADTIAVMNAGRIEQLGDPADALREPRARPSSPTSSASPTCSRQRDRHSGRRRSSLDVARHAAAADRAVAAGGDGTAVLARRPPGEARIAITGEPAAGDGCNVIGRQRHRRLLHRASAPSTSCGCRGARS